MPTIPQAFGATRMAIGASSWLAPSLTARLILIDAADTIASVRQIRSGTLSVQARLLIGAGAALFAAIGVMALAQIAPDQPTPP